MEKKVAISKEQCKKLAQKIQVLNRNDYLSEKEYIGLNCPLETKLRYFLYTAAICHQTHSLFNPLTKRKGWDYLSDEFVLLAKQNDLFLDPQYLSKLPKEYVLAKLKAMFSCDRNPINCTLDRLKERAQMLIECAQILVEKYSGKVENIFEKSEGYLFHEGNGLYELFAQFPAFSDPQKKKTTVVLNFVIKGKFFEIKDLDRLVPVMDYHMQRLLMRFGCIDIINSDLKKQLQQKILIPSDREVREAAIDAVRFISKEIDTNILTIHDFLWSLGRSCCNKTPLCTGGACMRTPCTFTEYFTVEDHSKCYLEEECKGARDDEYRALWQPVVDTTYY